MKRIVTILSVLGVMFGAFTAYAPAAPASSTLVLCNVNGTRYCLGDTNIIEGNNVVQKSPSGDNARYIDVTPIDSNCPVLYDGAACERVYLSYNVDGDRILSHSGSPDECDTVRVGSPSASTGAVWFQEIEAGSLHYEYVSQMCHNANAS